MVLCTEISQLFLRKRLKVSNTDMMHTYPQITKEMTDTKLVCPVLYITPLLLSPHKMAERQPAGLPLVAS